MKMDRTEILRLMVDEINVELNSMEHLDFIRIEQFDDVMSGHTYTEVLQLVDNGDFKITDDFFSFDVNGNLISFTDRFKRVLLNECAEEIIEEYSKLNHDDHLYLADLGVITVYDE